MHAGSRAVVRRRRAAKDDHVRDLRSTNHAKAPHVECFARGARPSRAYLVVNEFLIPGGIIVGGKFLDSRINWGNAFWFNFIPVTIGSIVGAWFLVIPFWFVNKDGFWKRQEREAAAKAAKEEKVVEA